jgi:CPA2 family monovalent cation:H+ antiporter-2
MINPLIFRTIDPLETWLRTKPRIWKLLTIRSERTAAKLNRSMQERLVAARADPALAPPRAVIVGYGPVGRTADQLLRDFGVQTVVVDLNYDAVRDLAAGGAIAVYGDASRRDILEAADIGSARYLLVTVPDVFIRTLVIITAKEMNPDLKIFTRARYINERAWLEEVGATEICTEEAETALGLAQLLLREMGADEHRMRTEIDRVHTELGASRPPA